MLDITLRVRVDVDALIAAQNDMGVCDAIERNAPAGKPAAMSAPHLPKVAGIDSTVPAPAHNSAPMPAPPAAGAVLQDRLAGWVSDLTTLHELTERLIRTGTLDDALDELLGAGAALVGAPRGLVVLEPDRHTARDSPLDDDPGPGLAKGLGLSRSDLGHIETVPRGATAHGRILDGSHGTRSGRGGHSAPAGVPGPVAHPDLFADDSLDPLHREVATRLGYAASYTVPLATEESGTLGAAVWLYDEPATPVERQCHLVGLYTRYATEHLARLRELEQARSTVATVAEELLPSRLPRVPGVQLAARHHTGPLGGGDWYDALPLPEGALGLAAGSVSGGGPSALAAMGRLRASLRAYAVMEGEDPVAVLSDLELLLRLTEPARTATALFGYAEPAERKIVLAGAGHAPPLVTGEQRTEFVETSLSAPLGMLACWEAPSVDLCVQPGETVLLYTDGLLRRTGEPMDRAFARLHSAAASVPRALRGDPASIADHVLRTVLPGGPDAAGSGEDIVLLAARFD
ncbi:PP2C family protein-serine/threonine phosphatase [Streptomyces peucetius]|uniref:Serine/threonine-protein phosphatase n=1 Tax=Streptomyces peucetius TaxID=1950 RepID=A0ABY6IHS5_STRPE|nr:PP2C family protein-serine/threonine phosphatase [Streptomyces peucetius]UYQ66568.1 serine/threonine-protein phosphatase [Streptomyces peucetius]